MSDLHLESLLNPLSDDVPCGPDLEYDPAVLTLQEAAAGRPEQQYGGTIIAAQEPDWRVVREQALQVAKRTRDLRIAMWLLRSGARLQGLAGAVAGLQLVQGLLERHWTCVHPQLDASDGNDPTMRLNALAPLSRREAALADLRAATLTADRASLTVRDVELAVGRAEAAAGETVPTEVGVVEALTAALQRDPALGDRMRAGLRAIDGIQRVLDERAPGAFGPDLSPARALLKTLADAADKAQGVSAAEADAATLSPAAAAVAARVQASVPVAAGAGVITSREDAIQALERVCEWVERHEPSHPAPLFIRRAQRLMRKNFIDIIRDLVPEGLDQVQKLAGIGSE